MHISMSKVQGYKIENGSRPDGVREKCSKPKNKVH